MRDANHNPTTAVLVIDTETGQVVHRVLVQALDLAVVNALARLQLRALRRGRRIRVRDAPEALRELLQLVGLAEGLVLEPRREVEGGEQLGVEEVVQPRDPPA